MPRKRVRSPTPDGEPAKKTKRATGKASTNATNTDNTTAAESTAQAGSSAVSKPEDGLNAGAKASARKPTGRPRGRPSARGRNKATGKVHANMGDQGNFQPANPARGDQRKNAKTRDAEADPGNDATEAKDSGPATATKTGDNIEVALGPSDSKEDPTYAPSPAEFHPAAAASHAHGAPTLGRVSEGIASAKPHDTAAGEPLPAVFHNTQAAGQEATTTAAGPSTPTDDHGPDRASSSGDSEDTGEEDPIKAGAPFKSIQWQRPVPSGISAAGPAPIIAARVEPLVTKPADALPTIEKGSSSPYLEGGHALDSRVNEPHPKADAIRQQSLPSHQQDAVTSGGITLQQPFPPSTPQLLNEPLSVADDTQEHPWPSHQQETAVSAGAATNQPFLQQGPQLMNVDTDVKAGETLEPFGYNTALVPPTTDNPRHIPKTPSRPLSLDRNQVPRSVFSSMERFLSEKFPVASNQGLWLRGVQYGIGHGLSTMKQVILGEIEHNGFMFGRPYPLDAGLTRAEQRKVIESNTGFDLLVAQHAGDTFMAAHSRAMRTPRRHGSNADSAVSPFPQAPPTYGPPAGHMNSGSTPTSPFFPRFATSLVGARVLAAQGPRYPQTGPSFPRPSGGPWMNPSPTVAAATQNYNLGDQMQPDEAALPAFGAMPDGLPQQPTDWPDEEFPRACPELAMTEDGRAVISMSRGEEGNDKA